MKSRHRVFVEVNAEGIPIRICKYVSYFNDNPNIREWPRKDATEAIRKQVFERDKQRCIFCGNPVTWRTMHMHEKVPRGQGGEMSLENSVTSCADCHINVEHGNRKPQWTKS